VLDPPPEGVESKCCTEHHMPRSERANPNRI
jgi:hypothetical protein